MKIKVKNLSLGIEIVRKNNELYYQYGKIGYIAGDFFIDIISTSKYKIFNNPYEEYYFPRISILETNIEKFLKKNKYKYSNYMEISEIKDLLAKKYIDLEYNDIKQNQTKTKILIFNNKKNSLNHSDITY